MHGEGEVEIAGEGFPDQPGAVDGADGEGLAGGSGVEHTVDDASGELVSGAVIGQGNRVVGVVANGEEGRAVAHRAHQGACACGADMAVGCSAGAIPGYQIKAAEDDVVFGSLEVEQVLDGQLIVQQEVSAGFIQAQVVEGIAAGGDGTVGAAFKEDGGSAGIEGSAVGPVAAQLVLAVALECGASFVGEVVANDEVALIGDRPAVGIDNTVGSY